MLRARILSIVLAVAALAAASLATARAQSLPGLALPTAAPGAPALPPGVRLDGLYWTAPIGVDGVPLFRIAVPAQGSDQIGIVNRAQLISAAIAQLLALRNANANSGTVYDPKSFRVEVQPAGDLAVLVASDDRHPTPVPILTVTTADAKYARVPLQTLAAQWQARLQSALVQGLKKRQPAELERNLRQIAIVGGVLLLLTLLAWAFGATLGRRMRALEEQIRSNREAIAREQSAAAPDEATEPHRRRAAGLAIRASAPEMTLDVLRAIVALMRWGLLLAWFVGLIWALALFPQTTPLAHVISRRVAYVAIVILVALVLIRAADIVVVRLAHSYGRRMRVRGGDEHTRLLLRIPTVASAINAFVTFVVVFIAVLTALGYVGISTASVLTLGGIVALGITFAAQNILRDVLNGFFVLFEDQYVIGDYVVIDEWSGIVENMTLRVVQLRDGAGNLITIPHGQTTQVVNSSRDWSRVDYRLPIDAKADVGRALALLREQIEALARDEKWRSAVLDAAELIGVESIAATGIVLRASVKTAPLRQFEVKRELNARVLSALREAGIALGVDPKVAPGAVMSINPGPS
ncbi:MAG TPA: mechanosensitive ion channel family protein [Verrucomicrobiae bacterium]|nr:mechanosensitive ion channel family protein [Verrucomicrobiae bacterium]